MPSSGEILRILFVTPFDEPVSGADESLLLMTRRLDRSRVEPHVLLPEGSHYAGRYEGAGVKVHPWPMSRMRRAYSPFFWGRYALQLVCEVRELERLLREWKIDLVHLNMHVALGALLAARRRGIPTVVHYRAKTNDRPKLFFDLFLPWLHRRSDAVLCISGAVARHFLSRDLGRGVHVLHNPVDLDRFLDPAPKDPFEGRRPVLFVGRIHPQKRVHLFLEALELVAREVPDLTAAIVGGAAPEDESYRDRLVVQSRSSGVPIEWVAHQENVAPYVRHAGALVLPSVNEGFGRVLVEGMAAGVPVIGARSGAIPEVLEGGNWGQLVTPDSAGELAAAIVAALRDPKWREVAEEGAVHAKESFSVAAYVDKLMGIYDGLTG